MRELALLNADLVAHGRRFSPQVRDWRLRLETAIIARLASRLNDGLVARDPLSATVHLSKPAALVQAVLAAAGSLVAGHQPGPATAESASVGKA